MVICQGELIKMFDEYIKHRFINSLVQPKGIFENSDKVKSQSQFQIAPNIYIFWQCITLLMNLLLMQILIVSFE